jgi:hypothetical protein
MTWIANRHFTKMFEGDRIAHAVPNRLALFDEAIEGVARRLRLENPMSRHVVLLAKFESGRPEPAALIQASGPEPDLTVCSLYPLP